MGLRGTTAIVGVGETRPDRFSGKTGEPSISMPQYLSTATRLALADAGLGPRDFDGQGFGAVISTNHPQPFWPEEAAEILGISPGLLLAGGQAGAAAVSLLGQAAAAIESGLVELVLVVAASAPLSEHGLDSQTYETRDFEAPFGVMGANSKIAMVMRRHMHEYGTKPEHLGRLAVAARRQAGLNPIAYLREPIAIEDYLSSRLIADPLRLLDCVLPANGGKAYVVASAKRAQELGQRAIYIRGFGERSNPSYGDRMASDMLVTGIAEAGRTALDMAGITRTELDFLQLYDNYLIIVQMQLEDLGFCAKGDTRFLERTDFSSTGDLPIQTGGGMINYGQPNTTGGLLHVIEAVHQLRSNAGARQVPRAQKSVSTRKQS